VVLAQHEPALGSTAASTALLQYENDTHLTDLARALGAERATLAYRACVHSFTMLEERFPELLAESDYQKRESVYLASDEKAVDVLRAELAARRAIGIHVDWRDEGALRRLHGCRRPCALVSPLAATLDPLRFTRGVLSACIRHGVRVYSRAPVERIEESADTLLLHVPGGANVRAAHVVVAAGYESMRFAPPLADIDNTFALVTEPMPDTQRAAALPQMWESARPYLYLRGTRDGRVMLGGADVPFRNAVAREALLPRQVRKLTAAYEDLFGEKLPPVALAWAGSFARTRDGLPYIGRVPGWNPRLQFALCYGGNGITFAVHAGEIVRAGIEGRDHPLETVFGFGRTGMVQSGQRGGARAAEAAAES
jgi:glycine/D-amino acid oxidase-like deaminating enzyme